MPGMRRKVTFIKLKIFRSERRRRRRRREEMKRDNRTFLLSLLLIVVSKSNIPKNVNTW